MKQTKLLLVLFFIAVNFFHPSPYPICHVGFPVLRIPDISDYKSPLPLNSNKGIKAIGLWKDPFICAMIDFYHQMALAPNESGNLISVKFIFTKIERNTPSL